MSRKPKVTGQKETPSTKKERASLAAATSVGEALQKARLKKNLTLEEISKNLNIKEDSLRLIEENKFQELPPQAYLTGFIRSYAVFLGLDVPEVMERFKEEYASQGLAAAKDLPLQVIHPIQKPAPLALLISAILLLALALYWFYTQPSF